VSFQHFLTKLGHILKHTGWTNRLTQYFTEKHKYLTDKQNQCYKSDNDNSTCMYIEIHVKVKQSLYRFGQTLRSEV